MSTLISITKLNMKVYLVFAGEINYASTLHGVFSDYEKALSKAMEIINRGESEWGWKYKQTFTDYWPSTGMTFVSIVERTVE